jgi:type I restriction enzyme M protein
MIKKENFRDVLKELGFNSSLDEVWTNGDFSVDFQTEKLEYPKEITIHGEFTKSFSQNENFVVFEAVFRLVQKGYKPEHIELEKKWKTGHGASGGRADILVRDNDNNSFMIIECKTWGKEFDKQKEKMFRDGGQLFAYWQQEGTVEYLVLYASTLENSEIDYLSAIVKTTDKESLVKDYEEASERDKKKIKLYKNSKSVVEKFTTWKKSYNQYFYYKGIFENEVSPYKIEIKPLLKKDLKSIQGSDDIGLFNNFAEILRNNSVGKKENAFSILVTMFLCKIVDETTTDETEELKFQWLPNSDTDENLQDRLQELYHKGMKEFLNQETVYYSDKYIEDSCKYHNKDVGMDNLKKMLKELKFYTNNEFAFKKVNNEQLFKDNAKVVREVVQLLETRKFVYSYKHKFLSNLFEKFLKNGKQQDEGQFFTPPPITKFITSSLPILRKKEIPKLIDYACGSGHFLIEAFDEIKNFSPNLDRGWEKDKIFGIERDDSLVEISKVSSFLNGAGGINTIYGNGLENYEERGIKPNSFDLVLANPPYSIKKFKEPLLNEIHNSFKLMEYIPENSSAIETLFIERLDQLLKNGGVAGVILPSSILSNDGTYSKAREIILKNFKIVAIVEFGSNTFVATRTNTITLFLEKKGDFDFKHFQNRAESIFSDNFEDKFLDKENLQEYENFRGNLEEHFNDFAKSFKISKDLSKLPKEKRDKLIREKFQQLESEKFIYFHIAKNSKVLIVKSGDKKVEKEFLGYEWSNRKGSEGLKEYRDENGKFATKLYDEDRPENPTKVDYFISQAFQGNTDLEIPEKLQNHISYLNLIDMLDFTQTDFNKAINTSADKKIEIKTKWDLVKLGEVVKLETGSRPKGGVSNISDGALSLGGEHIHNNNGLIELTNKKYVPMNFFKKTTRGILKQHDILLCKDGVLTGKIAILQDELKDKEAMVNEHVFIIRSENLTTQKYVFYILHSSTGQEILKSKVTGSTQGGLNTKNLLSIKIPLPPLEIQNKIVSEINKISDEVEQANLQISELKNEISESFENLYSKANKTIKLTNTEEFDIFIGKRVISKEISDDPQNRIPVFSANVYQPFGYTKKEFLKDFKKPSVLWGIDGDWQVNYISENKPFFPTDHCGVIRLQNENILNFRYLAWILEKIGVQQRFSRTYRASTDRIKKLTIEYPPLKNQNEIVSKIEKIESEIEKLNEIVENSKSRKNKVLEKYLK